MSKKTKRSRHRVPTLEYRADPIDDRYQSEIDASTARLERRYRNAQRALERAERRVAAAIQRSDYARLTKLVELRKRELKEIERLMNPIPNRDSRRRKARLEAGAIEIPLGATTGKRRPPPRVPTFPVVTK